MSDPNYSDLQNPVSAYAGKYWLPLAATASVAALGVAAHALGTPSGVAPTRLARPLAVAKAKTMINRFRAQSGRGHWPGLDRQKVANRFEKLIDTPHLVDQGGNGLCGEAAFFYVWLWEDPWAVARFAVQLYNGAAAAVGTEEWVRPRQSLKSQDFSKVEQQFLSENRNADLSAEWMMMSALRDANNWIISYDGTPSDDWGSGSLFFRSIHTCSEMTDTARPRITTTPS